MLTLTATPIPRSLALTLYGELDISLLKEKPSNRKPIITKIVSPNSRAQLNEKITQQLSLGRQLFVVCPLISETDKKDARSVEVVYNELNSQFANFRVGMLHGRMKSNEKDKIMKLFLAHNIDILVSTTVIEVGIDVPNASVMLIESADQFGLAQLHQLRGRVGRGEHQSYCYLLVSDSRPPSPRLRALERSNDGFALAELDLELRGPGAIYGTQQHGALDLKYANLADIGVVSRARAAAQEFIDRKEKLLEYEELQSRIQRVRSITNLN
jgi:ATP-dependent DNA helicase RecG